ncbi:MAG: hypothetical protein ACEPO2_11025 [Pelagibaca sp.]
MSLEPCLQKCENHKSGVARNFYKVALGLDDSLLAIIPNAKISSTASDCIGVIEINLGDQSGYEERISSQLPPNESPISGILEIPSLFAKSLGDRNEVDQVTTFKREEGYENSLVITSGLIGQYDELKLAKLSSDVGAGYNLCGAILEGNGKGYGLFDLGSTVDELELFRDNVIFILGGSNDIASQAQNLSDTPMVEISNDVGGVTADIESIVQLKKGEVKQADPFLEPPFSIKSEHRAHPGLTFDDVATPAWKWSCLEHTESVNEDFFKAEFKHWDLSRVQSILESSSQKIMNFKLPNPRDAQIIESSIPFKEPYGKTRSAVSHIEKNATLSQYPRRDLELANPILNISVEENDHINEIKFMSSSQDFIDLMLQKQSQLGAALKSYNIEGYEFSFHAGAKELHSRQKKEYKIIQLEDGSNRSDEWAEGEFTIMPGIDKRI